MMRMLLRKAVVAAGMAGASAAYASHTSIGGSIAVRDVAHTSGSDTPEIAFMTGYSVEVRCPVLTIDGDLKRGVPVGVSERPRERRPPVASCLAVSRWISR